MFRDRWAAASPFARHGPVRQVRITSECAAERLRLDLQPRARTRCNHAGTDIAKWCARKVGYGISNDLNLYEFRLADAGEGLLLTVLPLRVPLWGAVLGAFPEVWLAIALAGSLIAIKAVHECVMSGECLPRCGMRFQPRLPGFELPGSRDCESTPCDSFPQNNGKYQPLSLYGDNVVRVKKHRDYDMKLKTPILMANWWTNGMQLRDDITGVSLDWPIWNELGSKPGLTAVVDHRCPKNFGGKNSMGNACIIAQHENSSKRDTIPAHDYCTQ